MKNALLLIACLSLFNLIHAQNTLEVAKKSVDTLFFQNQEQALQISENQLPLAFSKKDTFYITYFLDQAGELNRMAGNYDKAIDQLNTCLNYKHNWKDLKDLSLTHNNLGKTYLQKGMYELATFHFLEALKLMETDHNLLGQSFYLNNLGAVNDLQHNYNQSLIYYNRSLEIKRKMGNEKGIAASLTNIGITYFNLAEYDKSEQFHAKAFDIYQKLELTEKWVRTAKNLAEVYIATDNLEEAEKFLSLALEEDSLIQDEKLRMSLLMSSAKVALKKNKEDLAKSRAEEVMKMAQKSGSYSILAQVYLLKSEITQTFDNNLKRAIEEIKLSMTYNDSLINQDNIKAVAEMQSRYEYKKQKLDISEKKLALIKKEKEVQETKASLFMWIGASVVLFLVAGILFIFYSSKRKRNQLLLGQVKLIEKEKKSIETLSQKVENELSKTQMNLKEKEALLENIFVESSNKELPDELLSLSKREMEVLSYLALGWSDDLLAEKLFVSKSTIKTHLRRIYSKLLVRGRAEAVAVAHKHKILGGALDPK